ncbi:hypothetical protein FANTH_6936 [Fusarium anthophilum]|uniref:Beta-lactamase family protein n=1 Tax=Fusarium anthophilum TaxID=48485 RepID=A0A8H5E3Q0_9HYPO|nr:hypothetical protein FANTH_6936 [Fusarium anthophilum]
MGYAADGQPEQTLYGNGVLATFQYDSATRLMIRKRLIHRNARKVVEDTQYSHDAMHPVIQSNDAVQPVSYFNNTVVDARCSYTHDTIGRLSSAQGCEDADSDRRGKSSVGIPSDSTCICRYTEEYYYDDADNITRVKHHAGPKVQMWVRSYAYEEESLVKEGESGNRLSYTSKSGQTEKCTYGDAASTGFTGSVISGDQEEGYTGDYVSGLVITYEESSPFGPSSFSLRRSKQEASRKYRFASYERDKETGLYYCNARYYAPWLGRWISPDPVGTKEGFNLYCYCGNDPVNYVDPTGPTGLFKAMRIAAVPMFKIATRMNEITKMSPVFEPYQRSWVSELSKPRLGSSPASLDDAEFLTEDQKLRKLEDYNAKLEQQVQRPLGRMSPELMKEIGTYDIKQYLTEFANTLSTVSKSKIAQSSLLTPPLATRTAIIYPRKAVNMDLFDTPTFTHRVEILMQNNRVPGLSVAVVQGDQVKSAGYGLASVKSQEPCTADTLFDIASSSKSLTAAAIALLVKDNNFPEVQYDSIVSELLPEDFVMSDELHTNTVTIDDLLGHHTGMPGHDPSYMGTHAAEPDDAQSITRNLRNLAVAAPPRTRYIYCNMMYTVLTHLIEAKSRQSFSEFLQKRIFDRLGMALSSLQPEAAKARGHDHRLAKGHIWDKKSASYRDFEAVKCPEGQGAGSVISSVNDFIKFLRALIDHNGPISEDVYQGLTRPRSERGANYRQRKSGIDRIFYTAGMDLYWQGGHAIFGHSGDITGFGSRFVFLPDLKFGAVVMGNSSGTNSVAAQLFREFIAEVINSDIDRQQLSASADRGVPMKPPEMRMHQNSVSQNHPTGMVKTKGRKEKDQKIDSTAVTEVNAVSQGTKALGAYTGDYWNPGYHNIRVETRDDELFIDATDRSMGFTARLKHKRDQSVYEAHVRDAFDTGDEVLMTEFIIEDGKVVRMGMDLEPLVGDLIWFDKVDSHR